MPPSFTATLTIADRVCLLDVRDFVAFASYSWFLLAGRPYASVPDADGRRRLVSLARAIAHPPAGLCVATPRPTDPDGPLDLRRHRLALLTRTELARVSRRRKHGASSVYRGVSFCKAKGRYRAYVTHHGKFIQAGYFALEVDAARARDRLALELWGSHSPLSLNFPNTPTPATARALTLARPGRRFTSR
jgi:hypothetical protein